MKMLGFAAHFWKPPSQPHILHKIDKKCMETFLQIHTGICVKNTITSLNNITFRQVVKMAKTGELKKCLNLKA